MNEELLNTNKEGFMTRLVRWMLNGDYIHITIKYLSVAFSVSIFSYVAFYFIMTTFGYYGAIFISTFLFPIVYIVYALFLILFCRGFYIVKKDLQLVKRIIASIVFTIIIFYLINSPISLSVSQLKVAPPLMQILTNYFILSVCSLIFFRLISKTAVINEFQENITKQEIVVNVPFYYTKRIFIWLFVIASFAAIIGGFTYVRLVMQVKNLGCEKSLWCFFNNLSTCQQIKISDSAQSAEMRIVGLKENNCLINIKVDSSNKEIVCKIPKNELLAYKSYSSTMLQYNNEPYLSRILLDKNNNCIDSEEIYKRISDLQKITEAYYFEGELNSYFEQAKKNLDFSVCKSRVIYSSDKGTQRLDETGWIPIDPAKLPAYFTRLKLSVPPEGDNNPYQFACDPLTNDIELSTNLRSDYYSNGGLNDKESTDGGNNPDAYEVGTNLNLIY